MHDKDRYSIISLTDGAPDHAVSFVKMDKDSAKTRSRFIGALTDVVLGGGLEATSSEVGGWTAETLCQVRRVYGTVLQ